MVPAFLSLLLDTESEVQIAAITRLCDFCHNLCLPVASDALSNDASIQDAIDSIIVISILPIIEQLVKDPDEHVKSAVASVILGLSPILGKQRYLYQICYMYNL